MSAERYGRTWEIRLPWSVPPASANDRDHWRVKADKVRSIRVAAAWAVADAMSRWPFQAPASPCRIAVGLTYVPRDKRRRDPDNLVVPLLRRRWTVRNTCTGGSIQVIGASGTGITIATVKTAIVECDGTNVLRITADACPP